MVASQYSEDTDCLLCPFLTSDLGDSFPLVAGVGWQRAEPWTGAMNLSSRPRPHTAARGLATEHITPTERTVAGSRTRHSVLSPKAGLPPPSTQSRKSRCALYVDRVFTNSITLLKYNKTSSHTALFQESFSSIPKINLQNIVQKQTLTSNK